MIPGMDPKKMQAMMKQLGIKQETIDAKRVIIEKEDFNIIIDNPSIIKINMQGQENFQISGDVSEQNIGSNSSDNKEDDIKTIMEKTGCSDDEAIKALEEYGDLTEAILSLS